MGTLTSDDGLGISLRVLLWLGVIDLFSICNCVGAQQFEEGKRLIRKSDFNRFCYDIVRKDIQIQAQKKLEEVQKSCNLTTVQANKLKLALAGDINRYFNLISEFSNRLDGTDKYEELESCMSQIRRLRNGIFKKGSLFEKIIASALDSEQKRKYDRMRELQLLETVGPRFHLLVFPNYGNKNFEQNIDVAE